MDPITQALAIKTLDALSVRANVTAQNIANAGSPGYRPLRVSFEAALAAAVPNGTAAITHVQPTIDHHPVAIGESGALRLDLELSTAAATGSRYAAVVEVLNRQMQLMSVAGSRGN